MIKSCCESEDGHTFAECTPESVNRMSKLVTSKYEHLRCRISMARIRASWWKRYFGTNVPEIVIVSTKSANSNNSASGIMEELNILSFTLQLNIFPLIAPLFFQFFFSTTPHIYIFWDFTCVSSAKIYLHSSRRIHSFIISLNNSNIYVEQIKTYIEISWSSLKASSGTILPSKKWNICGSIVLFATEW